MYIYKYISAPPCKDVVTDLQKTEPSLVSHSRWDDYPGYCMKTMTKFGAHVADKLMSKRHFLLWSAMTQEGNGCTHFKWNHFHFAFTNVVVGCFECDPERMMDQRQRLLKNWPWTLVVLRAAFFFCLGWYVQYVKSSQSKLPIPSWSHPAVLLQDAFNKAQKLMAMPTQPILVEEDGDGDRMPAVKRAKTGKDVERALKGDSLMEVPRQSVSYYQLNILAFIFQPHKQGFINLCLESILVTKVFGGLTATGCKASWGSARWFLCGGVKIWWLRSQGT